MDEQCGIKQFSMQLRRGQEVPNPSLHRMAAPRHALAIRESQRGRHR